MHSNTIHIQSRSVIQPEEIEINDNKSFIPKSVKAITIVLLMLAGISSLASYTMVLCQENALEQLHSKTLGTQMDNIDISNDVEFSRSLYNVYGKSRSIAYLHKPTRIIEVDLNNKVADVEVVSTDANSMDRIVAGY